MYCPECGTQNDENAFKCIKCGKVLQEVAQQPPTTPLQSQSIPSYLAHSILATLFCCMPFGIVAIVYAAQVNGKIASGDTSGAMESSNKAKTWCWVSLGVGLAVIALAFVGGFFTSLMGGSY